MNVLNKWFYLFKPIILMQSTNQTKEQKAKEASDANRKKQMDANRVAAEANHLRGIIPLNGNSKAQQIASNQNRDKQREATEKKRVATAAAEKKRLDVVDSEDVKGGVDASGTVFFGIGEPYETCLARAVAAGQVAQDAINVAAAELDADDLKNIDEYFAKEAKEAKEVGEPLAWRDMSSDSSDDEADEAEADLVAPATRSALATLAAAKAAPALAALATLAAAEATLAAAKASLAAAVAAKASASASDSKAAKKVVRGGGRKTSGL